MYLFYLAIALLTGEIFAFFVLGVWVTLWPLMIAALLWFFLVTEGWFRHLPTFFWVFLLGVVLASYTDSRHTHLVDAPDMPSRLTLDLTVSGEGHMRQTKRGTCYAFPAHYEAQKLWVVLPPGLTTQVGQRWRVTGSLSRKRKNANRYRPRNFMVFNLKDATLLSASNSDIRFAIYDRLSQKIAQSISRGFSYFPEQAAICRMILLGRKNELSRERRELFSAAGTVHIFAISGLHVMLVAHALVQLLAYFGFSLSMRGCLAVPLVIAYVILTGAHPSAVRAALMAGVSLLAPLFSRHNDMLSSWAFAVLVVYGLQPEMVFDVGCTLSFLVMFAIVGWIHWMGDVPILLSGQESILPFFSNLGVAIAAWAIGVPISACVFERFTFGGLLANPIILRLVPRLLLFTVCGAFLSYICPPFGMILSLLAGLTAWLMTFVSELVANLPGISFKVAPWSWSVCLLWYGIWMGLAIVFAFYRRKRRHNVTFRVSRAPCAWMRFLQIITPIRKYFL